VFSHQDSCKCLNDSINVFVVYKPVSDGRLDTDIGEPALSVMQTIYIALH